MAPDANLSVSLKDTVLFAMSGWPEIRPDLPSFCLKIHEMQKTLAVTWTEEPFVVGRFVWKWLVGRIGAEELPDLVRKRSAMNAEESDILPGLALGDREITAVIVIEEIADVAQDLAVPGEF